MGDAAPPTATLTATLSESGASGPVYYHYSPLNWLETTLLQDTTAVPGPDGKYGLRWDTLETNYRYSRDGNIVYREDPKRSARYWMYDLMSRVDTMRDEFGAYTAVVYDGLLVRSVHGRAGDTAVFHHDRAGRDTLGVWRGGAMPEFRRRIVYDLMDRPITVETADSRISRTYTLEGALATEIQFNKADNLSYGFAYSYWPSGLRRTLTMPSQRAVDYRLGPDNLISMIRYTAQGGGAYIDSVRIVYDRVGRRDSVVFRPKAVNIDYDHSGTLLQATWKPAEVPYGYDLRSIDAAGRPVSYRPQGAAPVDSAVYDRRGHQTKDGAGTYWYDAAGNRAHARIGGDTLEYKYDLGTSGAGTDRLISAVTRSGLQTQHRGYRYNANGSMVLDSLYPYTKWHHVYDAAGHLRSHDPNPLTAPQYRYDGFGRMFIRRVGTTSNIVAYDGTNVAQYGTTEYIHGDGVDDPLVVLKATPCYYVTAGGRVFGLMDLVGQDCLGSLDEADEAGAILNSTNFDLYRYPEVASSSPNVQLSYFRNRWYDSRTGRFTQEDPIGYAGGSNLYAYAGNNPASYTDPFGLCPEDEKEGEDCREDIFQQMKEAWANEQCRAAITSTGLNAGFDALFVASGGISAVGQLAGSMGRSMTTLGATLARNTPSMASVFKLGGNAAQRGFAQSSAISGVNAGGVAVAVAGGPGADAAFVQSAGASSTFGEFALGFVPFVRTGASLRGLSACERFFK